jgi:hypothetical protein
MNYLEFKAEYLGKKVGYPTDSNYYGECLSLVKWYLKRVIGIANPPPSGANAAYGYWTNFPAPLGDYLIKIPNTPTGVPKQGSVVVWKPTYGPSGHIAIVDRADTNRFTCLSLNDPLGTVTQLKEYSYTNIYGWLEPKEDIMDMYKGYDLDNKDSMRVAVDLLVRVQAGEFVEKPKYEADVKNAYDSGVIDGKAQAPTGLPEIDPTKWAENGLTIESTDGGIKRIVNYKKI